MRRLARALAPILYLAATKEYPAKGGRGIDVFIRFLALQDSPGRNSAPYITHVPKRMSRYQTLAPLALSVKATTHESGEAGCGGNDATHSPSPPCAVVLNEVTSPPDLEQLRKVVMVEPAAAQPHTRAVAGADCSTACSLNALATEKRDAPSIPDAGTSATHAVKQASIHAISIKKKYD
jgi:hypothetical protein